MPKLTRIYTRTGDKGMTGLVGGTRVAKSSPRIEAYGTLDELSSALGVARASLGPSLASRHPERSRGTRAAALDAWLAWTQDLLFNLGSELATPPEHRREGASSVGDDDVAALERAIDRAQQDLPPLANFIHPGGSLPGAQLHFARTICRRAERLLVALVESEAIEWSAALPYLNRLSDALFVWARWINDALGVPEHIWNQSAEPPKS
ncbi:MAG TPA: cob(I)yrinic acid a,c-diamide adenosyltransferase [Candidatus Nitrosotalea sp.]|nr:cob(I)yrinic acid a,c-diamide adenosyltransferase [Candidatus Nitrosotalea sp.]